MLQIGFVTSSGFQMMGVHVHAVPPRTQYEATNDKTGGIVQEAFDPLSYAEVCEEEGQCKRF
jgi:hypothetical protein